MTMNRVAYGDVPAAMMSGGGMYGGGSVPGDAFSQAGGRIMPVGYTPPARMNVTYSGMYAQSTGFFSEMASFMGMKDASRSQMTADHIYNSASDFGERVGGAIGVGGVMTGGIAAGAALAPVMGGAAKAVAGAMGMGSLGAGAIGGMASMFAAPALGMAAADTVVTAVNERREMNNFLENQSFRFVGAGSSMSDGRTRGMSRGARAEFTEFAREMDLNDKFMDMGDLQTVLESGTSKGLFAGAGGDMESFQKKFKEITNAVKNVTRSLGQTLEEGMKTLQELKSIGVDPTQAREFISQADSMGRVAGMSGAEMLQVGTQGANMFRGTGIDMGIGAQANMMNMASVRAARDAGTISEEAVMQAGGEAAMAQRMTASGLAFSQSAMGRGMTAAFVQGGQFNSQSFIANAFGGGGDVRDLGLQAARNLSSPADLIAFQANQEEIISEMGQQFGGQGLQIAQMNGAMAQASMLSQTTGASMKDAFKATLKSQGMSAQEVEMRMSQIEGAGSNFEAMQAGVSMTENQGIIEEAARNNVFNRASAAIGDKIKAGADFIASPVNSFINSTQEAFTSFKESQLYGIQRADMGDVDASLTGPFKGASFDSGEGVNLDAGGIFAKTAGEGVIEAVESGLFADVGVSAKDITATMGTAEGRALIEKRFKGGGLNLGVIDGARAVMTRDQQNAMVEKAQIMTTTSAEAKAMEERGVFKDINMPNIGAMAASGNFDDVQTVDDLVSKVYGEGETVTTIGKERYAALVNEFSGTSMQGLFADARKAGNQVIAGKRATEVMSMQRGQEMIEGARSALDQYFDGDVSTSSLQRVAAGRKLIEEGKTDAGQAMIEAAKADMFKAGASTEEMKRFFTDVEAGKQDDALFKLGRGAATMAEARQRIGRDKMASTLLDTLSSKEMDDVDTDVKDKITAVASKLATSPGGIEDLSGEDIATISKAGNLGKAMSGRLEQIQKLASGGIEKMDRSERRQTLESVLGEGKASDIIRKMDQGDQVDFASLVGDAKKKFEGDFAGGKSFASAASAGSAEEGTQSAMELAKTQTSINLQVLTAMEALAQRLR